MYVLVQIYEDCVYSECHLIERANQSRTTSEKNVMSPAVRSRFVRPVVHVRKGHVCAVILQIPLRVVASFPCDVRHLAGRLCTSSWPCASVTFTVEDPM